MGCKQVKSRNLNERKKHQENPEPNLNSENKKEKNQNEQPLTKTNNANSNPEKDKTLNNNEIKESESQHENKDSNNNNINNQQTENNKEQHDNNEIKKSNLSVKNNVEENATNKSIHQNRSEFPNKKIAIMISKIGDKETHILVKSNNNNILKDWEVKIENNTKIGEVISSFNKETSNNIPPDHIKINEQIIPPETLVKSIIPESKNEIILEVDSLYLPDLTECYQRDIATNTNMLGKLIECNNELRLLIFYRKTHGFSSNQIKNQTLINETQIKLFSKLSALCNGNNTLYISGGEDDNCIPMKHFWTIDLSTENITLHSKGMPLGKRLHSMIFIPQKYVFIIGGIDKNVYYYISDSDSFKQWIPLEEDVIEPALAYINNSYLFAFSNSIQNNNSSVHFHRTNLKETPRWQIIQPKLENDSFQFNQKFFGCCYDYKDNKVIFFGGNKFGLNQSVINESTSIAYDWNENQLVDSHIKHIECDLDEKTFLPFNDKYSFIIPSLNRKKINFYFYNNVTKEFKSMNFVPEKELLSKKINKNETSNNAAQSVNHQIRSKDKIENKMMASENINNNHFSDKLQNSKYCFNMPIWSKKIEIPKEENEEHKNENVNQNEEEIQEQEQQKSLEENAQINLNSQIKQSFRNETKSYIQNHNFNNTNHDNIQISNTKSQINTFNNVFNFGNDIKQSKIISNNQQDNQEQSIAIVNDHQSVLNPSQIEQSLKQSGIQNNNNHSDINEQVDIKNNNEQNVPHDSHLNEIPQNDNDNQHVINDLNDNQESNQNKPQAQPQLQESNSNTIQQNNDNDQNKENKINKETFNIHKSTAVKIPQNKGLPSINNNPKHASVVVNIKSNPK